VHLGLERPDDGGARPARPRDAETLSTRQEDGELARRAASGDGRAFEELVARHYRAVLHLCHAMTAHLEDARDLTQECFARAWERRAEYRGEAPYRAWLSSIVRNRLRDELRARRRRGPANELAEDSSIDETALESDLIEGELEGALGRELARLAENERRALVLRVVERRDYDDVARTLGVRPATARTLVMKARRILLERLWSVLGGGAA
jgi:RNA polymerase sigma-70 factor, ECF subfamily